jgi:hypothetical protein
MFEYIIVDIADRYYEEDRYFAKFYNYEDAKDFLKGNRLHSLIDKLDYLESIKDSFCEYHGRKTLVISYC